MQRRVDGNTALTFNQRTQAIPSEGTRMSRKCSRLKPFIRAYGDYLIDTVINAGPMGYSTLITKRFHSAITAAAHYHQRTWELSGTQLWSRFTARIRREVTDRRYAHSDVRLVLMVINTNLPCPTQAKNRPLATEQLTNEQLLPPTDLSN